VLWDVRSGLGSQQSNGGLGSEGDPLGGWRAGTFAEAEAVELQVLEFLKAGQFEGVPGAIEGAAVNDQDRFRVFGLAQQAFDAATDTSQAGHLCGSGAGQFAGGAVSQFAGVGTTGAGVDEGSSGWLLIRGERRWRLEFGLHA